MLWGLSRAVPGFRFSRQRSPHGGQQAGEHPGAARASQKHPAYGSIYRTFSRSVPRFLEELEGVANVNLAGRPAYMRWRHLIFERRVANDDLVQVKLPDLRLAHLQNAAQDVFVMLAKTIRLQLSPRRPTREFCSKTWNIEFPDLPILDPAHSTAFTQMRMTHGFV